MQTFREIYMQYAKAHLVAEKNKRMMEIIRMMFTTITAIDSRNSS